MSECTTEKLTFKNGVGLKNLVGDIGLRSGTDRQVLETLLGRFCFTLRWHEHKPLQAHTAPDSPEMTMDCFSFHWVKFA